MRPELRSPMQALGAENFARHYATTVARQNRRSQQESRAYRQIERTHGRRFDKFSNPIRYNPRPPTYHPRAIDPS
jgi:hypothetical protein